MKATAVIWAVRRLAVIQSLPFGDLLADSLGFEAEMGANLVGDCPVSTIYRKNEQSDNLHARGGLLMLLPIASCSTIRLTFAEYALLSAVPLMVAQPGSFRNGSSHMIKLWIEIST
jgi:hypothetical protein